MIRKAKGYLLTDICQHSLIGMSQTHKRYKPITFFAQRVLLVIQKLLQQKNIFVRHVQN